LISLSPSLPAAIGGRTQSLRDLGSKRELGHRGRYGAQRSCESERLENGHKGDWAKVREELGGIVIDLRPTRAGCWKIAALIVGQARINEVGGRQLYLRFSR
jgi:hypothetical protein